MDNNIIAGIIIVAVLLVSFALLYAHQKHLTAQQLVTQARTDPKGTLQDVFAVDKAYLAVEFDKAHQAISEMAAKLTPKPFPGAGATFVDLFAVGEQYGLSGAKQGVVLDGRPVRTGVDPAIVLKTVDGAGITRTS